MRRFLTLMLIAISLLGCQSTKNDNELVIACNLPMTGYIGMYGEWIKRGMEMAADSYSSQLDSLNLNIKINYQDNKGVTKDAINIMQKHLTENPNIYMSGVTNQTMAIKDKIFNAKISHFLWSFTPLFMNEGDNAFRTWVNFGVEARNYLEFCKNKNPQRIAILHIDLSGTKEQFSNFLIPEMKKINPNIKFLLDEYPSDYTNFKPNIIKIKDFNPDVLIIAGFSGNIVSIIKEIEVFNIDKNKIICSMDLMDTASGALSKESLESLSVSSPSFNIAELRSSATTNWIEIYKQRYNENPEYTEAYAYDTYQIIVEAYKNCNGDLSKLQQELLNVNIEGITGTLKFTPAGDLNLETYICKYNNGELKIN